MIPPDMKLTDAQRIIGCENGPQFLCVCVCVGGCQNKKEDITA